MALAFFSAPALPGLWGFGKAAEASDDSKPRPESMSAEAVIKCSDCGGDVVLAQLGEHICTPSDGQLPTIPEDEQAEPDSENILAKPPELDKTSKPDLTEKPSKEAPVTPAPHTRNSSASIGKATSSSGLSTTSSSSLSTTSSSSLSTDSTSKSTAQTSSQSSTSTSSLDSLKEKLLNSMRPDLKADQSSSTSPSKINMSSQKFKATASSEDSFSNSESSSSSNSSSGRMPFFERYAQLMPKTTNNPSSKATSRDAEREKDDVRFPAKKPLSPITSPESSPSPFQTSYQSSQLPQPKLPTSKSMPFSNLTALGAASQRREALTRNTTKEERKIPNSSSAASGLDRLIAREHEELSRTVQHTRNPRPLKDTDHHHPLPRAQVPTTSSKSRTRTNDPSVTGLEDLMGDLMAEMEKKAELSSEEYQKRNRQPVVKKILVPETTTPKSSSPGRFKHRDYETDTPRKYPSAYPDDTPRIHGRQPSDPSSESSPSSPGIRPSDSISQLGYTRSPSPRLAKPLAVQTGDGGRAVCERCMEMPIRHVKNPRTDEARFCAACYAELYLPKCRKCAKPIERGAVTDRVGKVLGKYHAACFNCFQCNAPFPNGEFYVWERRPVCSKHYHRLAGTTCCNQSCGRGIEGPCVSLFLDGSQTGSVVSDDSSGSNPTISNSGRRKLYHPEHFSCSRRGCATSLHEFHFVVNKMPWCERHALQEEDNSLLPGLPLLHHQPPLPPPHHHPSSSSRDPRTPLDHHRLHHHHPSSSRLPSDPRAPLAQSPPPRRMERRRTIIQNVRNR
ncbi:hypothetical protein PGT21_004578 [Puccinia graminis f. sp. tritici]|uniref:LIM zinc-binding domain-containing protein n=1 Tax=Puccinia graminis f. sp. tritici TaxID=56615 RepID=A0A5B0S823_PUCGR|nr:hypothetical protein PGT21_004578 [Puccinia graminis f. sp. tritici]KAA1134271.1 hypothetical protein PGTUg99_034380 [Puccinia graminis f. sp. tritici]